MRFADAHVRDAPFDVAAACVAWVQDKHFRRCYTRLQSAAADDDGALCAPLGVHAAELTCAFGSAIDPFVAVQTRRAVLLDLISAPDGSDRALEIEFTDLELRLFELLFDAHIVLLSALPTPSDDDSVEYVLQFRDLHDSETMPSTRNVLFVGHVDNGSHAVAVVPHDLVFTWLRRAMQSSAARELVPSREAQPAKRRHTALPSTNSATSTVGPTASSSQSKATSISEPSFGPESFVVKVPTVAADRTTLSDAIAAVNVTSKVCFQKKASRDEYVQFKCSGSSCPAKLSYSLSENGLLLNEDKCVLAHTCRSDAAQDEMQQSASAKKWTRSMLSIKQLLRLVEEHEIDVTEYKSAKAFFDAIVRRAGLGNAALGKSSMYKLFDQAQTQLFGTLEEQVGKLQALFKLLEEYYGGEIKTVLKTRKEGDKDVLESFAILMPYAKNVMQWGTRTLAVDDTFSGDEDHRIQRGVDTDSRGPQAVGSA